MGVDARGVPGGLLRFDPAFAYVEPPSSWPLSWAEYLTLAPNRAQLTFASGFTLQHRTLLPSPVTSTTGYCFCFGSISSFFLELFLHWSPVAYRAPTNLGVHLSVSYLFDFSFCSWHSQGKNTEVVCYSLLQWTMFRNLHHDPSILGGPTQHGS